MLLLLNYRHNKMKREAELEREEKERQERRKRRKEEKKQKSPKQPPTSSSGKDKPKRRKTSSTDPTAVAKKRRRRFEIPPEKKWEAYTIFFIGFCIPAIYGLFNVCNAIYHRALLPVRNQSEASYRLAEYVHAATLPADTDARLSAGIERRKGLSLEEFYRDYDAKWPVLIADCVPEWPAAQLWNEEFFNARYGSARVTMSAVSGRLDNAQQLALPFGMFISHLNQSSPTSWTYLQDELFLPTRPELLAQVGTCAPLREDFFSLYPETTRPWWAFLLWGTRYSRSQLHIDPYNWTGTNAVLRGRKRWKLYPPGQDHLLYPRGVYTGKYPLRSRKYNSYADAFDPQAADRFPLLAQAKCLEFVQQPGELLIIPTGWFHQAFNEEPTLAISGQLMNRGNYRAVLEELAKAGNFPRDGYPANFESLSPAKQTQECLARLYPSAMAEAAATTKDVLDQVEREGRQYESGKAEL